MSERERKITEEEAMFALDILNSPADQSDIVRNNQIKTLARKIVNRWEDQSLDDDERHERTDLIEKTLTEDYFDSSIFYTPPIEGLRIRHTNPITPTSLGTGLPTQTKSPRDLREKE